MQSNNSEESSFYINTGTFTNNKALIGGVIYSTIKSNFSIHGSKFANNSAITQGGVIVMSDESSFTFTNNSATDSAGAIQCAGGSFNIDNSRFNTSLAS